MSREKIPYHLMTQTEKIDFVEQEINQAEDELLSMKSELEVLKSCEGCPCHIHSTYRKPMKHKTPCRGE